MRAVRNNRVLYVVVPPPGHDAPTKHALAIAQLMGACGWKCEFLVTGIRCSNGQHTSDSSTDAGVFPFSVEIPESLEYAKFQVIEKYSERLTSARAIDAFEDSFHRVRPGAVVYYGISAKLARAIQMCCHEEGVPAIVDETDWFDARLENGFANYLFERSRSARVERVDCHADGVLAISPFFEAHFRELAVRQGGSPQVLFLPPLNPAGQETLAKAYPGRIQGAKTRFFYAGSLGGRKDLLVPFIRAVERVAGHLNTEPFLDVYGVSEEEAARVLGCLPDASLVCFHGRQPHDKVITALRAADFGVLLRYPERYARAGFSTKFAECMSNGVPMLCNRVGGADSILDNGVDGIVIPDTDDGSIDSGLRRTCNMGEVDLGRMKASALRKARFLFDIDRYLEPLGDFMDRVVDDTRARQRKG